ncbi:MAG: hypothetical protein WA130_07285 [Candidatus Methanoperedens sp.]
MSILQFFGLYSATEYNDLKDQYAKVIEEKNSWRKQYTDLDASTFSMVRENAHMCQSIENLHKENNQLNNTIKELTTNFNTKREREQTEIERSLIAELDLKKAENYTLNIELRDAKSIIDHITGMSGANFYITDMIKFIKEKQQQEKPHHE